MPAKNKAQDEEDNACPNCGEALFDDCLDCGKRLDLVGAQFCPFCANALQEPEGKDVLLEPWRQLGAKATLLIGAQRWHALAAAFAVATTIGIALGVLILGILRAVPASEVNTVPEAAEDEHLRERGTVRHVEDAAGDEHLAAASPLQLSATPASIRRGAPAVGEHTREILTEAGFDDEAIDRLFDADVVCD